MTARGFRVATVSEVYETTYVPLSTRRVYEANKCQFDEVYVFQKKKKKTFNEILLRKQVTFSILVS